jgi:hypothetical protein
VIEESQIRARIRTMLATNQIACDEPERLWAGNGSGVTCAACLELIPPTEIEYEAQFAGRTLHFHLRCHRLWLEECEPDGASARPRS